MKRAPCRWCSRRIPGHASLGTRSREFLDVRFSSLRDVGNLEDADASASQLYASASRSFHEARELLARVKNARGYFPVVGVGAFDGLAQPSTDRKPAKSRGKGKKVRGKENPFLRKVENRQAWVHLAFCPNHRTHVSSLVLRCLRSVRAKLAQLVVDHITLFVFVLISGCCVDKCDIVLQNVPTKGNRRLPHLENVHLVPWVVQCSIPRVMVQLSKKSNKIKDS